MDREKSLKHRQSDIMRLRKWLKLVLLLKAPSSFHEGDL